MRNNASKTTLLSYTYTEKLLLTGHCRHLVIQNLKQHNNVDNRIEKKNIEEVAWMWQDHKSDMQRPQIRT